MWNFRVFCHSFWKIRKNSDLKFENRNFFFKFPLLRRSFFRDFFFFPETSHTWISGQLNLQNFGTFEIFSAKSEKNPISSLKFCKISNFKSNFFQILQKKSQIFQNSANLIVLKFKCAKFQEKKNSRKNDLRSSGNLKKKFRFSNFRSEFFLIFQKKRQKSRKFRTFIYREPHLSRFWAKKKKLFSGRAVGRSGGRSLPRLSPRLSGEGRRS